MTSCEAHPNGSGDANEGSDIWRGTDTGAGDANEAHPNGSGDANEGSDVRRGTDTGAGDANEGSDSS